MSVPAPGPEELRHLAHLAGLEIGDADLPKTLEELERILGFMAGITAIAVTHPEAAPPGAAEPIQPLPDDVVPGLPPIDLAAFAPEVEEGLVLCPPLPHQVLPPA